MSLCLLPHPSPRELKRATELLQRIKGVVFDVDGTLTIPGLINFKRIREGANVPIGYDIFPYIRSHYQGEDYAKAMKVVEEEELKAQQNVKLQKSDANELITFLNNKGIKVALLTRNGRLSMEHTMSLFTGHIDLAYCREIQPSKPNVDPFLKICEEWNLAPTQLLLAGDHLDDFIASIELKSISCFVRPHYDAGSHVPVLKSTDGLSLENCLQSPQYIQEYRKTHSHYVPDLVVDCISDLYEVWKMI